MFHHRRNNINRHLCFLLKKLYLFVWSLHVMALMPKWTPKMPHTVPHTTMRGRYDKKFAERFRHNASTPSLCWRALGLHHFNIFLYLQHAIPHCSSFTFEFMLLRFVFKIFLLRAIHITRYVSSIIFAHNSLLPSLYLFHHLDVLITYSSQIKLATTFFQNGFYYLIFFL